MKRHTCETCGKKRYEDRMRRLTNAYGHIIRANNGDRWLCGASEVPRLKYGKMSHWCDRPERYK